MSSVLGSTLIFGRESDYGIDGSSYLLEPQLSDYKFSNPKIVGEILLSTPEPDMFHLIFKYEFKSFGSSDSVIHK